MTDLPPLPVPVEDMNQTELRTFIPQLLKSVTGRERLGYGKEWTKPRWWPREVPWTHPKNDPRQESSKKKLSWTEALRKIVKSCYQYHGQAKLLSAKPVTKKESSPVKVVSNMDGSVSFITNRAVVTLEDRRKSQFVNGLPSYLAKEPAVPGPVPVSGPIPAQAFHQIMPAGAHIPTRKHVVAALPTAEASTVTGSTASEKSFVEIFICFFCEGEFSDRQYLQKHQVDCPMRPPKLQVVQTPPRPTRSRGPPCISPKRLPQTPYRRPDRDTFISALGLLPVKQAEVLKKSQGREVDCEIIDFEEAPVPKTPTTPRTPKSLISQLSRDASPPPINKHLLCNEDKEKEGGTSDLDSECSKSDVGEDEYRPRKIASLLSIALSSPLGLRVKKHICMDKTEPSRDLDYERFCHTPVKNKFREKLRHKLDLYPITFKKTKRNSKSNHEYKFSKKEKREFVRRVETGLDAPSRALKRQMKKCSVIVRRLSKEIVARYMPPVPKRAVVGLKPLAQSEILRWIHRSGPNQSDQSGARRPTFPMGPSLLEDYTKLQQLLGLKTRLDVHSTQPKAKERSLSLSQVVSEDVNAEVTQQKAVVYKTLLSDYGGSASSLTPPSTPTKSPAIERMPLFEAFTLAGRNNGTSLPSSLNVKLCSNHPNHGADNYGSYGSLPANSHNVKPRAGRRPDRVIPREFNARDQPVIVSPIRPVVYGGNLTARDRSSAVDQMCRCEDNRDVSSLVKTYDGRKGLVAVENEGLTRRPIQRHISVDSTGSAGSKTSSGSINTTSVVSQGDKYNSRLDSQAQDDVVISISDSEGEDSSGVLTRSKRRLSAGSSSSTPAKRRKIHLQDQENVPKKIVPGLPASPNCLAKRNPTVLFKCHLCHAEIAFQHGLSDSVITTHFQQKHGVYNLHLIKNKDQYGNNILTIVEDTSRSRKSGPNGKPPIISGNGTSSSILYPLHRSSSSNIPATGSNHKMDSHSAEVQPVNRRLTMPEMPFSADSIAARLRTRSASRPPVHGGPPMTSDLDMTDVKASSALDSDIMERPRRSSRLNSISVDNSFAGDLTKYSISDHSSHTDKSRPARKCANPGDEVLLLDEVICIE